MAIDSSEIIILPPDDPNKKRLGFRIFEEVSAVINTQMLVPTFEMALNPTVSVKEIKERRFCTPYERYKSIYPDINYRFEIMDL